VVPVDQWLQNSCFELTWGCTALETIESALNLEALACTDKSVSTTRCRQGRRADRRISGPAWSAGGSLHWHFSDVLTEPWCWVFNLQESLVAVPVAAGLAAMDSMLGSFTAGFLGADAYEIDGGILGYNGALTALTIASYYVNSGPLFWVFECCGAIASTLLMPEMKTFDVKLAIFWLPHAGSCVSQVSVCS